MSVESIIKLSDNFCYFVEKTAKKKSKKVDPKAAVRDRGKAVFPYTHPKVKDKKTHFPITNENQARNALSRAGQYTKAPPWFSGSLEELKNAVSRAVHKAYPKIDVGGKKTKKSDLEVGLQKQGALKEHIDADFNYIIKGLELTRAAASSVIQKLEKVKSTYTVEFNPELEHNIVENMPRMKEVARDNFAYLHDLNKRVDEILKRIKSDSTKSSKGPISAPSV
jgi:hypothetical protein